MNVIVPLLSVLFFGSLFLRIPLIGLGLEQRRKLLFIGYLALGLRLALVICLQVFPRLRLIHDDAAGYEVNSMALALSWRGLGPPVNLTLNTVLNHGYVYVGASLCYLFGVYQMQLAAWNGLFGVLTAFFLYRLALHLFHEKIAFRAVLLLCFMPSMIVWNSVAIKDPVMVLLVTLALYMYLHLRQRFSMVLALGLAAVIVASFFVRFYITYFLILSIVLTVFIGRARQGTSPLRSLLVVFACAIIIGVTGLSRNLSEGLEMANLEHVAAYRFGMATTANSGFAHDLDISSPRGALMALPIGISVVLFGPFPWQMRGLLPMMMLPEMLLWWYLIPSLWRGLRFTVSRNFARSSPVLVFCLSLTVAYSLTLGNVGAAARQRTQIFVFLFIFVALGQYLKFCRKHRVDPKLLVRQPGQR